MKNTFRTLNQLYYLVYTMIILLTISGYFVNLNNLLNVNISKTVEVFLIGFQMLITSLTVAYFGYFLFITSKLKNRNADYDRVQHYLKSAKIRLLTIGVCLFVGVVCFYLVRSTIILYLLAISAILLLLSKPNEANISEVLS